MWQHNHQRGTTAKTCMAASTHWDRSPQAVLLSPACTLGASLLPPASVQLCQFHPCQKTRMSLYCISSWENIQEPRAEEKLSGLHLYCWLAEAADKSLQEPQQDPEELTPLSWSSLLIHQLVQAASAWLFNSVQRAQCSKELSKAVKWGQWLHVQCRYSSLEPLWAERPREYHV